MAPRDLRFQRNIFLSATPQLPRIARKLPPSALRNQWPKLTASQEIP